VLQRGGGESPGTVNKQAGLEKAGAVAHAPEVGKLVKVVEGRKFHRRRGKIHFPREV
jgi:hypothetical protein